MRLGYCIVMGAEDPRKLGLDLLPEVAGSGFDYVEVPLAQVMELDDDTFHREVLTALDAAGLPCEANNNFLPASIRLTGPDPDTDAALSYAVRALDRARTIGSSIVIFGSSGARNAPAGFPLETARAQYLEWLRVFGTLADDRGICVVIEHLNRLESNVMTTFEEGMDAVLAMDTPGVGMLLDTYHFNIGNEDPSLIRRHATHIDHVHLARTFGRGLPREGDEGDTERMLSALHAGGYDGRISLEAYLKDPDTDLAGAAETVRNLWRKAASNQD